MKTNGEDNYEMLPSNYLDLNEAEKETARKRTAHALAVLQRGRQTVAIGVTEKVAFKYHRKEVLEPGNVYRVRYEHFEELRLDSVKSRKVCLMEPDTQSSTYQIRAAIYESLRNAGRR